MPSDAFSATYSDWKLIRTRAVVQIVLEVPVEQADHAYNVLGGMPNAAKEIWVGVARFKPGTEVMPNQGPGAKTADKTVPALDSTTPARARKSWHELALSAQAGMLCDDPSFDRFLREQFSTYHGFPIADAVRHYCDVKSRKDILPDTDAGRKWKRLVAYYREWQAGVLEVLA